MADELTSNGLTGVPLAGSARTASPGTEPVGAVDPAETAPLTLVLRRRGELPEGGPLLSRAELAAVAGASPADVAAVTAALTAAGATVLSTPESSAADRLVQVEGPVGALAALFGAELTTVTGGQPGVTHRQRTGELTVPPALAGIVTAVLGLDDRPQSRAHFRAIAAAAAQTSYSPLELAAAYGFPPGTDGTGQTLAIVELGGGYADAELTTYFTGLGITGPMVRSVGVGGAVNVPGADPSGADGEVLLDIEVAGALAPQAGIVVYFAPNTDAGFLQGVTTAAHATPTPTAMSISWGQSEDAWTAQARAAMDDAFADAAALGVTVTVAAGDDGSSDRVTDGKAHVDFPASSPHVLACGGTALHWTAAGGIKSETVWNDKGHGATGGGVSDAFAQPAWQAGVGAPAGGRGVPDVAGDADPATGYAVLVDGSALVIGGTSAVAPLWAALVCRLAQSLGRPLGLLAPALYAGVTAGHAAPGFRDITKGSNGAFRAHAGWDACTGLGTPVGTALLARLQAAGTAPAPPAVDEGGDV